MTVVLDPYKIAADKLAELIATEFAAEGVTPLHDKLHESLGNDGIEVAISPIGIRPTIKDNATLETTLLVQFYNIYDREIDPYQQVDPRDVSMFFARFHYALETYQDSNAGNEQVWYFLLSSVDFPDDPTGNKSRFEARVQAFGANQGLVARMS